MEVLVGGGRIVHIYILFIKYIIMERYIMVLS